MKNIKLLSFVLIILLAFTGCSSDDNGDIGGHFGDDGSEDTRFTGSWRAESVVSDKEIDFNGDGYATRLLFEEEMAGCEKGWYWVFRKRDEDKLSFNIYNGESWMECSDGVRTMWKEWTQGTNFHFIDEKKERFVLEQFDETEVRVVDFKEGEELVINFNRTIDEEDLNITVTLIPSDAPFN